MKPSERVRATARANWHWHCREPCCFAEEDYFTYPHWLGDAQLDLHCTKSMVVGGGARQQDRVLVQREWVVRTKRGQTFAVTAI